jgi:cytochrome b
MMCRVLILADADPVGIVIACAMLFLLVLIGAFGVAWLRKWFWGPDDPTITSTGFTLGDLRQLHRSGRLSDEEFQKARDKIVAGAALPPRKNP